MRHTADQSLTARATAAQPHHLGIGGGLVEKHQSGRIKPALLSNPASARAGDVGAFLFRRAQTLFFESDLVPSKEPPESAATAWNSSLAHRDKRLIQGQIRLPCNQSEQP